MAQSTSKSFTQMHCRFGCCMFRCEACAALITLRMSRGMVPKTIKHYSIVPGNKLYKPSCHVMVCEGAGGWVGGGKGQTCTCESPSMRSSPSS